MRQQKRLVRNTLCLLLRSLTLGGLITPPVLANDGIYSGPYTFSETGLHTITGQVTIPTAAGPLERCARTSVTVRQPAIRLTSIQGGDPRWK